MQFFLSKGKKTEARPGHALRIDCQRFVSKCHLRVHVCDVIRVTSDVTSAELRMAFAMLDRSRSGRVSVDDIDQTMQSLGFEAKEDEIKTFVKNVANGGVKLRDRTSDVECRCSCNCVVTCAGQVIREHEFVSSMEDLGLVASRGSVVKQAFHTFDRDNDGFISKVSPSKTPQHTCTFTANNS